MILLLVNLSFSYSGKWSEFSLSREHVSELDKLTLKITVIRGGEMKRFEMALIEHKMPNKIKVDRPLIKLQA